MHFILIKPVFSDHLSYVTLFQSSQGRSHKTGLTVELFTGKPVFIGHNQSDFIPQSVSEI